MACDDPSLHERFHKSKIISFKSAKYSPVTFTTYENFIIIIQTRNKTKETNSECFKTVCFKMFNFADIGWPGACLLEFYINILHKNGL